MSCQWGSQNYFKDCRLINSQPTFLFLTYLSIKRILAILSNGCKLDKFVSHNSLKLSFVAFVQILLNTNLSLNQTLLTFCLWDKLRWLNWFWQFLCNRLSSYSLKGFYYSWSCSFCEGRMSFCTGLISRKLYAFLPMFLTGFTTLCLTSFFSINHLLCLYALFWWYFIKHR